MSQRRLTFTELSSGIGEKKALWLVRHYGGCGLPRPEVVLVEQRDRCATRDWLNNYTIGEIMAKYGMTKRQVDRIKQRYRAARRITDVARRSEQEEQDADD